MKRVLVFVLATGAAAQSSGRNHEFGSPPFRIVLPDCYERSAPAPQAADDTLAVFLPVAEPSEACPASAIVLTRLGGVIGKEPVADHLLPPGAESFLVSWRDFEVQALRFGPTEARQGLIELDVQLPLKPALQIAFVAAPEAEQATSDLLTQVVASVVGDSNWLSSTERAEKAGQSLGIVAVAVMAVAAVILWFIRRHRA